MLDEYGTIDVTRTQTAVWVRLARPESLNALDARMVRELRSAVAAAADDPPPAFVLTGSGRGFCAGVDLKMVQAQTDLSPLRQLLVDLGALTLELEALPLPTVAMVNGVAVAGGLELILACDLVVAARGAVLGDGHAKFGLVPGAGASQRLPRAIGVNRALQLMYTGETLSASEALGIGLVTTVVEDHDLERATEALTVQLAERSSAGLARMKRLVREGLATPIADGMARERDEAAAHLASADVAEGLRAFEERRKPRFR